MEQEFSRTLPYNDRLRAVVAWMAGALVSFVVAAVSIRTLARYLNPFEINICRTGGGLAIICGAMIVSQGLQARISLHQAPKHLLRNLFHALGGLLWTLSISLLPLAMVFSLEFTAPVWAALLSVPILGERTGKNTVIGLGASLLGTLIILRPSTDAFNELALLPLGAAACLGISALFTRRLTRSQSIISILFWMMSLQLVLNIMGAFALETRSALFSGLPIPAIIAAMTLAISGLSSQLCLSNALKIGEANMVMPLDFLRVPLIAWIGYAFYQEPIDIWVFVGAAIIALGVGVGLTPAERC